MALTESMAKMKLKIRLPSSNYLQANSDRKSCENIVSPAKLPVTNGGCKRKTELVLDGEQEKRRRMDPILKKQCGAILDTLIKHPNGWAFESPVDPVALKIPDYFSIISNPMDLGTIKSKLASNRYFTAEEFASDIRLTFSNAMLYNSPDNPFHRMAKVLESIFIRRWKLLEAKRKRETASFQHSISSGSEKSAQDTKMACNKKSQWLQSSGIEKNTENSSKACCKKAHGLMSNEIEKNTQYSMKACCKKSQGLVSSGIEKNAQDSCCKNSQMLNSSGTENSSKCKKSDFGSGLVVERSMSEEKQKLRKDLTEMLTRKLNGKPPTVLQKFGFFDSIKEKIDLDIDALHDDILLELNRVLKDPPYASSTKDSEYKILFTQNEIQDCSSKNFSTHACRLNLDSGSLLTEGSGNCVDEENVCPYSSMPRIVTTDSGEGWTSLLDDEQARKKALRAEMLKIRYSDIISKTNGGADGAQKGIERAKRLQCEETALEARIQEQQLKKEAELKSQTEKQREAAALALKMIENTVQLDDNLVSLKELEMLSCCSATYVGHETGPMMVLRSLETGEILKPLEQLGLHMKEEFVADDDEETSLSWEGEEGEILE